MSEDGLPLTFHLRRLLSGAFRRIVNPQQYLPRTVWCTLLRFDSHVANSHTPGGWSS